MYVYDKLLYITWRYKRILPRCSLVWLDQDRDRDVQKAKRETRKLTLGTDGVFPCLMKNKSKT